MRNKKVFPIDRYHQKLLGLYQRQLKKWRNDIDNWNDRNLKMMLHWDVNNGIARRSWARNKNANFAIERAMEKEPLLKVTLPSEVNDDLIEKLS